MDENVIPLEEFMRPRCKVKVGDYFYKSVAPGMKPDRIKVVDVQWLNENWIITGKYISHINGPTERKFSDTIFSSGQYVIESS